MPGIVPNDCITAQGASGDIQEISFLFGRGDLWGGSSVSESRCSKLGQLWPFWQRKDQLTTALIRVGAAFGRGRALGSQVRLAWHRSSAGTFEDHTVLDYIDDISSATSEFQRICVMPHAPERLVSGLARPAVRSQGDLRQPRRC